MSWESAAILGVIVVLVWALLRKPKRRRRRSSRKQFNVILWLFALIWMVIVTAWRLGAWIADRWFVPDYEFRQWVLSDQFYQSPRWKAVRNQRFMINRVKHAGLLKCEIRGCKRPYGADEYHGHHLYPRSTHPEIALKLGNTAVACAKCNISLGNRYIGHELRPNPRLA